MTHISKKKLQDTHRKQLVKQFANLFTLSNPKKTGRVFESLCTESEQIMLIKRLAIILMLDKKYSRYRIAQTLMVSESTVREIKKKFDEGDYAEITVALKQREYENEQFWESINALLRLGMPSRGKDRWKSLH